MFEITGGGLKLRSVAVGGDRHAWHTETCGLPRQAGLVAVVVLAALLSGCTGSDEGPSNFETETARQDTTPTAADDTSTTAPTNGPVSVEQLLVLRHDGLGLVSFGQPVDEVMDGLKGL